MGVESHIRCFNKERYKYRDDMFSKYIKFKQYIKQIIKYINIKHTSLYSQ